MNLTEYLNSAIDRLFRRALRASLFSTREFLFMLRTLLHKTKAAKKRQEADRSGTRVPPFLIASITTQCNLRCAGCYARANNACSDCATPDELSAERWGELFTEAESLGVSFILLAGGEPLKRPDVLARAAQTRGVIYPVFTNGTLLEGSTLKLFDRCRNLIPVVSIEGDRSQTDARRGNGIFDTVDNVMHEMKARRIFYGVSITVDKNNLDTVSSEVFIDRLHSSGCKLVLFVEYVPVDGTTEFAPGDEERELLSARQDALRARFTDMILLSFPGDEKALGGCLAAGRAFFHINAAGGAEPCPFSPFSDTSLKTGSLTQALNSELFSKIRQSGIEAEAHIGGCALFERRELVEAMLLGGIDA